VAERAVRAALAALLLIAAAAPGAGAQAAPMTRRMATGQVVIAKGPSKAPAAGVWVTLHRIGRDSAGAVDSVRTDAGGRFGIPYLSNGDTSTVFIAAAQYANIAYFSDPVGKGPANVVVYDTASAGVPLVVESRHVVVAAATATGLRTVTEVIIVSNPGTVTRVAGRGASFTARIPAGIANARPSDGDVGEGAMAFSGDSLLVTAPIAPGTKRIAFAYDVDERNTVELTRTDASASLEILVEDSAATVAGVPVKAEPPIAMGARTFTRFTTGSVPAGAAVRVSVPVAGGGVGAVAVVVTAIALAMVVIFVVALRRDQPVPVTAPDATLASGGEAP
jgi:5-hydroxyisourate hydrolase-like protein (transthyretin family)